MNFIRACGFNIDADIYIIYKHQQLFTIEEEKPQIVHSTAYNHHFKSLEFILIQ